MDKSEFAGGPERKILVVDDNAVVLKTMEMKLKQCGFNVMTASDASTGLSAARREVPDVIVLDINFTVGDTFSSINWDGLQILRWLKQCKEAAGVPIIILTGDEAGKSRETALAEGAAAYFEKPVDWKVFITELRRIVGKKSGAAVTA